MEANGENGKIPERGDDPGPPGPPQPRMLSTHEEVREPLVTEAHRLPDGGLTITFFCPTGPGVCVQQTYIIGDEGKQAILKEAAGGITLPG